MLTILLGLFRLIWLFGRSQDAVAPENLALRQQVAIYKRKKKRPRLIRRDRWFWIALASFWKDCRQALLVVHPDTVVRWQRQFRSYWADLSKKRGKLGRPSIGKEIRELIQTMARANPFWRAPRIHGELLKLGIEASERTVSRILQTVDRPPSQTWKTFLQNHVGEIVAIDFFTVPHYPLAGSICVSRVGASTEESTSFRSHGTSERRMGRPASGRSPHRTGRQAILEPRP
jgi:putative transposase